MFTSNHCVVSSIPSLLLCMMSRLFYMLLCGFIIVCVGGCDDQDQNTNQTLGPGMNPSSMCTPETCDGVP